MTQNSKKSEGASPAFADAVRAHQAGRLDVAERLYRQVLAADPTHIPSLHYLGILAIQNGRTRAAIDLIGRVTALNETLPEPQYNLALALQGEGRLDEAASRYRHAIRLKPGYAEAHMNLGNILMEQGRFSEAADCYERVIALDPRSAFAQYNLANALGRQGRPREAEARYRAALACNENFAEAWNNLGNVLKDQERLQDAEAAYARALALKPNYSEAHNNLGSIKSARGALAEALTHYREAVRLNTGFVDAHKNLGLALARSGQGEAALRQFRHALSLRPDDVEAVHHLARELLAQGAAADAVSVLTSALDGNATAETKSLFALAIQALSPEQLEGVRSLVTRALAEGWARGGELEHVGISLVKRTGAMAACIARVRGGEGASDPARRSLDAGDLAMLTGDSLLHTIMVSGRVADSDLERVLTFARRVLLGAAARDVDSQTLAFFSAIAQQCFINEYVFSDSEEECAQVESLRSATVDRLQSGGQIPPAWLLAVASYGPLYALPGVERLLEQGWPEAVTQVLTQQVREVMEERAIRGELPALTAIDADSVKVQEQYEENPYPRWIVAPPAIKALTVNDYLRAKFPLASFRPVAAPEGPDVLIAGCGSGSHAIEAHRRFAAARVLAIDLSRTSLAYAVRKTRQLGLSIEYAQADILKLGALGRSFDVIEANGSLQCLKDPAAGWRVLLSLLKPGGVMSIGLYSKRARADINAVRDFIGARGCGGSVREIRHCRQEILAFPDDKPGKSVAGLGDFYSTSDCRDLLFHVQEYQHTLPEIAGFIAAEKLRFLGFLLDARMLRAYGAAYPDDPAMIDLTRWEAFERANPQVFAAMYQFVVQKQ